MLTRVIWIGHISTLGMDKWIFIKTVYKLNRSNALLSNNAFLYVSDKATFGFLLKVCEYITRLIAYPGRQYDVMYCCPRCPFAEVRYQHCLKVFGRRCKHRSSIRSMPLSSSDPILS